MEQTPNGELVPVAGEGGDNIPLFKGKLVIGRRESCDVCLLFPNISGKHCEMNFVNGVWSIKDLDSTNGIKVNGERVSEKRLMPDDHVTIGKREYQIHYIPGRLINNLEEAAEEAAEYMRVPLMERAGLEKGRRHEVAPRKRAIPANKPLPKIEDDIDFNDV